MSKEKADGAAGARWASAIVGIAACSENAYTTMDEDGAKVDLKLSFRDPFKPKSLVTVHSQVKSGKSFRAGSSTREQLTLKLDQDTLRSLNDSSNLGVIFWVPPPPHSRIYWYAQDPRSEFKSPAKLSRSQYVTPSLRFDLARLASYANWSCSFSQQTVKAGSSKQILQRARVAYREMKSAPITHPLVGELGVTRFAWRHVTRRSKSASRRDLSLRIVPYLKKLLSASPDRFVRKDVETLRFGGKIVETRFVLCWYRNSLVIDQKTYSVLLRIKEEITYPAEWLRWPLSATKVTQTATLASWWCKEVRL